MRGHFRVLMLAIVTLALLVLPAPTPAAAETVNIYSWAGYVSEAAIAEFEKETGIDVNYDTFDSLEALETKMLTGKSGYDVIFPSGPVLERLRKLKLLAPLDKSQIPNWAGLDPVILEKLSAHDPGNAYGAAYMWGTIGIGYNADAVKSRLPDAPLDSLALLFDPANAGKLADCGIGILDSPSEVLAIVLNYLGLPTDTGDEAQMNKAKDLVLGVRKHIRNIRNDNTVDALGSGEVCLQFAYGPDVFAAMTAAAEGNTGAKIEYFIPKEGTIAFFDSMAIPEDAPNKAGAHRFIDFLLRPKVMAESSDMTHAANAVPASRPMMNQEIANNLTLYPPEDIMRKLLADKSVPDDVARLRTRAWADIRAGQ
ncbi:MAG: extracellular solute-binding protein [Parvibaculaceae bacterium]